MIQFLKKNFGLLRLKWIYFFFLPFLFLPFCFIFNKKYFLYFIPAFGAIITSLISNNKNMLETFDHYANYPSLIIYIALIIILSKTKNLYITSKKNIPIYVVILTINISFLYGGSKPLSTIYKFINQKYINNINILNPIQDLKKGSKIIVHKDSIGLYASFPNKFHIFDTNLIELKDEYFEKKIANYDYLVLKNEKENIKDLPSSLLKNNFLCKTNGLVFVYCKK